MCSLLNNIGLRDNQSGNLEEAAMESVVDATSEDPIILYLLRMIPSEVDLEDELIHWVKLLKGDNEMRGDTRFHQYVGGKGIIA